MVQTSFVSNSVASLLNYLSGCYMTQFLLAQKSSLNGNLLQFSFKTGHIPGLLHINLFQRETTLREKEISSCICFKSCRN